MAESDGEGINANHGSRGTLIENNRVFAVRAVGIYADAAPNTTIRRNIVVGTANREFWLGSDSVGAGIAINDEKYHYKAGGGSLPDDIQSKDVKIESNVGVYLVRYRLMVGRAAGVPRQSARHEQYPGRQRPTDFPGSTRRPPAACSPITCFSASARALWTSVRRNFPGSRLETTISARAIPEVSSATPVIGTTRECG